MNLVVHICLFVPVFSALCIGYTVLFQKCSFREYLWQDSLILLCFQGYVLSGHMNESPCVDIGQIVPPVLGICLTPSFSEFRHCLLCAGFPEQTTAAPAFQAVEERPLLPALLLCTLVRVFGESSFSHLPMHLPFFRLLDFRLSPLWALVT